MNGRNLRAGNLVKAIFGDIFMIMGASIDCPWGSVGKKNKNGF